MVFEPFTLAWCKAQPPVPGRTWIFVDGDPRGMLPTGHTRPPALRPAPARRLGMYIIPRPRPVVAARGVPVKRRDVAPDPEFEIQRLLKWLRVLGEVLGVRVRQGPRRVDRYRPVRFGALRGRNRRKRGQLQRRRARLGRS